MKHFIYFYFPILDYKSHVPKQKSSDSEDAQKSSISALERRPQPPAISCENPVSEDFMDLPTYMALIGRKKDFIIDREGNRVELQSPVGSLDGNACRDAPETEFEPKFESSGDSHQSELRELDRSDAAEEEPSQECNVLKVTLNEPEPYKEDVVLLTQSKNPEVPGPSEISTNDPNSDSEIQSISEKHSGKVEERAMKSTLNQADGSSDALVTDSSTPPHSTNILPLDHTLSETPPRAAFLEKLKMMKRSSSVISDSGIESEPSSVVWPLDIRAGVAGSRDPSHLCRRRVHRNSLEGLQTESHGSLPSATQASLSSISSLPYEDEDEERQRQLNTLTKSASAPQISSPDNNNDNGIQDSILQEKVAVEASGLIRNKNDCSNVDNRQEVSDPQMFEEMLCKQMEESEDIGNVGLISNISEILLFHDFAKETPDEASDHDDLKDCSVISHGTDLNDDDHVCEAISFQDIHLSEIEGREHGNITDTPNHENQISSNDASHSSSKASDLQELPTNGREETGKEGHARTNQVPSSGLAFMNKKVVEVVNLSVSCAPTCLPFSSVLRDSPSVSGLSVRQANSPITHQPLGSFGLVSSSSSSPCTEQEISERMLK